MARRDASRSLSSRDCCSVSPETSCLSASWVLISAWSDAFLKSASMIAVEACCWRWLFSSCTRRLTRLASADFTFNCASFSSCSRAGLLSSRMIVPGSTSVPGFTMIRSTRPLVVAGIHRRSSGTSVPVPRTCRIIDPRWTVSIHNVARSTPGAAGFSRETPTPMTSTTTTALAAYRSWRVRLRFRLSGRTISITRSPGADVSCVC